jgi:hypothetical protein
MQSETENSPADGYKVISREKSLKIEKRRGISQSIHIYIFETYIFVCSGPKIQF